jgi:hypothetical protein
MGIGAAATARQAQGSTAANLRKFRLERLFVRIETRELLEQLLRILLSTKHERKRSRPENFPPLPDWQKNLYLPGTTSIWSFASAAGTYVVGNPSSRRTIFEPCARALAL